MGTLFSLGTDYSREPLFCSVELASAQPKRVWVVWTPELLTMGVRLRTLSTLTLFKGPGWPLIFRNLVI